MSSVSYWLYCLLHPESTYWYPYLQGFLVVISFCFPSFLLPVLILPSILSFITSSSWTETSLPVGDELPSLLAYVEERSQAARNPQPKEKREANTNYIKKKRNLFRISWKRGFDWLILTDDSLHQLRPILRFAFKRTIAFAADDLYHATSSSPTASCAAFILFYYTKALAIWRPYYISVKPTLKGVSGLLVVGHERYNTKKGMKAVEKGSSR